MKTSPKDFFLHLGVMASLYAIVIAFINLAIRIIDFVYPRDLFNSAYYASSISTPTATLIIVFPLFILLSWLLNMEYRKVPEKRGLWIRKWLIYITLFIAGIVVVVDLIAVLISFLSGDTLTIGFILKALVVLLVALAVFGYYIYDLRDKTTKKVNAAFTWISGIIILALIIYGFSVMGSPRTQRLTRIDQQKVNDLQNIQWQIVNFWQQKERLPESLKELNDPISGFIVPIDSQTSLPYEYEKIGGLSFELCAEFNLAREGDSYSWTRGGVTVEIESRLPSKGLESSNWSHNAGRECFERTVDPELYPPRSKTNL